MSLDGGFLEIKEHFHMMVVGFLNDTNNSSKTIFLKPNQDEWKCADRDAWRDFYQYGFWYFSPLLFQLAASELQNNNKNINSTASTSFTET